jgi:hypothetical protein
MIEQIKQYIREIVGTQEPTIQLGTIESVNGMVAEVKILLSESTISARLIAAPVADVGVLSTPKVGSFVAVALLSDTDSVVVLCSELEMLDIIVGAIKLQLNGNELLINDGENGGLVKVEALTAKISALEAKVNDLITRLQGVVIPLAPSGTYPFLQVFSAVTPIQPTTQRADLENELIKH